MLQIIVIKRSKWRPVLQNVTQGLGQAVVNAVMKLWAQ